MSALCHLCDEEKYKQCFVYPTHHDRYTLERNSEELSSTIHKPSVKNRSLYYTVKMMWIEYITWVGYSVYIYNRERCHGLGISLKFTLARITFSYSNHNSVLPFQYALETHSRDRENSFLFGTTVDTMLTQAYHCGKVQLEAGSRDVTIVSCASKLLTLFNLVKANLSTET